MPVEGRASTARRAYSSAQTELEEAWTRIASHFDTLFTTEHSIDQLKQTILQLAVMGKLVPQDPNDEPASVLLEKTMAAKSQLIKNKVIRNTKEPVLPPDPPAYALPGTWVWTNLYEIGEIGPRNDAENGSEASFIPMQLISEYYGVPVEHEIKQWGEIKNGFTHFKEEDVVLAKITPCFQNGKSAVMRGLINGFGAGTTELHVYRSINSCTVPEYVLIYLKSPGFILQGISKMTGTAGQKRITRDYFAGNHFPLPPLAEQHRIVAKVDELMVLCDALKARLADAQTTEIHLADAIVEQAVA
jgi:type I restriction enzyme S subunit